MSTVQNRSLKVFLTIGAQMPFDRLVKAVDDWAEVHTDVQVFAQVGSTSYRPRHIDFVEFIEPAEFHDRISWADVIVSHAGMGSILTALRCGKPMLVMPRLGRLHETRNDHQVATVIRLRENARIAVAMDERELVEILSNCSEITVCERISSDASEELLTTIRQFIHECNA